MAPNGEWDVLGWLWGLGLPIDWFDVTHIVDTLDNPPTTASKIDQLVLGWEGTELDAWGEIRKLLRPRGYFVGLSSEGKIRFPRLRMANVSELASPTTVAPIPYTLRWEPTKGEGVERIVGSVGGLPWRDGAQYEVNVAGDTDADEAPGSYRYSIMLDEPDVLELDLSTRKDDGAPPLELISLAMFRAMGAPILYIKANDSGSIGHGDTLKVTSPNTKEPWFIDENGVLIDASDDPRWFGQVIGFRRNLGDGTIDLTMQMNNWHNNKAALLRAPAAVVASVSTATYTCDAAVFSATDDCAEFTVGDKVELWTPDGVRRSGTAGAPDVQEITAIGTNTLTLDAAFTTAPTAGDIIRWARVDGASSGNDDNDSAKLTGYLPYACLADAADTISPNNLDAHTYGFGTI